MLAVAEGQRSPHPAAELFQGLLADCGTSLPEQDAMAVDPGNPRRFLRSTKWKKAMEGFVHGRLAPAENTPDRDRTCNLQLRRLTLYPIELRGQFTRSLPARKRVQQVHTSLAEARDG